MTFAQHCRLAVSAIQFQLFYYGHSLFIVAFAFSHPHLGMSCYGQRDSDYATPHTPHQHQGKCELFHLISFQFFTRLRAVFAIRSSAISICLRLMAEWSVCHHHSSHSHQHRQVRLVVRRFPCVQMPRECKMSGGPTYPSHSPTAPLAKQFDDFLSPKNRIMQRRCHTQSFAFTSREILRIHIPVW